VRDGERRFRKSKQKQISPVWAILLKVIRTDDEGRQRVAKLEGLHRWQHDQDLLASPTAQRKRVFSPQLRTQVVLELLNAGGGADERRHEEAKPENESSYED
jgi:hypothetical protein